MDALEPHKNQPLLFSGGMDSSTILAGLLELSVKPDLYTYVVDGVNSKDLQASQEIAERFSLRLHVVSIPPANLVADVKEIIDLLPSVSKSAIQCGYPMRYLAQRISGDGRHEVLCGVVGIVEDNKKVHLVLREKGEDGARQYRREVANKNGLGGTEGMRLVSRKYGVELIEPYREKNLLQFQLSLDMADLNFPRQKGIALRAFPKFFEQVKWRRNSPHQINSGVRNLHDTLLTDATLNYRNNRAVIAVYNNLAKLR